jgi:hypothetical protein
VEFDMTPRLRFVAAASLGLALGQAAAAAEVVATSQPSYAGPASVYDEAVFPLTSRPALDFYSVGCPLQADQSAVCNDPVQSETPPLLGLSGAALPSAPALLSFGNAAMPSTYRAGAPSGLVAAGSFGPSELASVAVLIFSFWLVGASLRRSSTKMA